MRFLILPIVLAGCLAAQSANKGKARSQPPETTMSGCIDQASNGTFVLARPEDMEKIVTLHGDSFPDEGFAKDLGHLVKVTGRAGKEGDEPVFRVKKVETVSQTCSPPAPGGH